MAKFQLWWGNGVDYECSHETQVENELQAVGELPTLGYNPLADEQKQLLKNAEDIEAAAIHGNIATGTNQLENQNTQVPEVPSVEDPLVNEQATLFHEANIIEQRVGEESLV